MQIDNFFISNCILYLPTPVEMHKTYLYICAVFMRFPFLLNLKRNMKSQLSFKRHANYLLQTKCSIVCKKFVLNYLKLYWKQSTHKLPCWPLRRNSPIYRIWVAGFCHFPATNFWIQSPSAPSRLHVRQRGQLQATNAIIHEVFVVTNAAQDVADLLSFAVAKWLMTFRKHSYV